jgi:hypothetical protein
VCTAPQSPPSKKAKTEKGAKTTKKKPADGKKKPAAAKKPKKEPKKEEPVYKWWEEEPLPEGQKWRTLEHNGPLFPPAYEPLPPNVYFKYDGTCPTAWYRGVPLGALVSRVTPVGRAGCLSLKGSAPVHSRAFLTR